MKIQGRSGFDRDPMPQAGRTGDIAYDFNVD
jgi:hypothetical protein